MLFWPSVFSAVSPDGICIILLHSAPVPQLCESFLVPSRCVGASDCARQPSAHVLLFCFHTVSVLGQYASPLLHYNSQGTNRFKNLSIYFPAPLLLLKVEVQKGSGDISDVKSGKLCVLGAVGVVLHCLFLKPYHHVITGLPSLFRISNTVKMLCKLSKEVSTKHVCPCSTQMRVAPTRAFHTPCLPLPQCFLYSPYTIYVPYVWFLSLPFSIKASDFLSYWPLSSFLTFYPYCHLEARILKRGHGIFVFLSPTMVIVLYLRK